MANKGSKQARRAAVSRLKSEVADVFNNLGVTYRAQHRETNTELELFQELRSSLSETTAVADLLFMRKHSRVPDGISRFRTDYSGLVCVEALRQTLSTLDVLTDNIDVWDQATALTAGTNLRFYADLRSVLPPGKRLERPVGIAMLFCLKQATLFFYFVLGDDNKYKLVALPTVLHQLATGDGVVSRFNKTVEHFNIYSVLRDLLTLFNAAPTEVISLLVDVFKDVSSCGPAGNLLRMNSQPWVVEQDGVLRYCTETEMFV